MIVTKYISYSIIGILVVILSLGYANYRGLENSRNDWREDALANSELITEANGIVSRRSVEIDDLKTDNNNLQRSIDSKKERIRSLLNLNASLIDSLLNVSTIHDTIILADSSTIEIQRFDINKNGFSLLGHFEIQEPFRISFSRMLAEFNVDIAITQNKDKVWTSYISSENPSFVVNSLVTQVNTYRPGFLEKLKFSAGGFVGPLQIGIITGVIYDQHKINILMSTQGGAFGYERIFKVR